MIMSNSSFDSINHLKKLGFDFFVCLFVCLNAIVSLRMREGGVKFESIVPLFQIYSGGAISIMVRNQQIQGKSPTVCCCH